MKIASVERTFSFSSQQIAQQAPVHTLGISTGPTHRLKQMRIHAVNQMQRERWSIFLQESSPNEVQNPNLHKRKMEIVVIVVVVVNGCVHVNTRSGLCNIRTGPQLMRAPSVMRSQNLEQSRVVQYRVWIRKEEVENIATVDMTLIAPCRRGNTMECIIRCTDCLLSHDGQINIRLSNLQSRC